MVIAITGGRKALEGVFNLSQPATVENMIESFCI